MEMYENYFRVCGESVQLIAVQYFFLSFRLVSNTPITILIRRVCLVLSLILSQNNLYLVYFFFYFYRSVQKAYVNNKMATTKSHSQRV